MKKLKLSLILLVILLFVVAFVGCSEARVLKFSSESYTVETGISFVPNMKIRPKKVEYQIYSSNHTIATVENNIISTQKEGVVTLTLVSGKKETTATLYVMDQVENMSSDIVIKDVVTINLIATNFEIASLDDELLQTVVVVKGNILSVSAPYIKGYAVNGWYTDRACTNKFDTNTAINEALKLYCFLTEQKNSFIVKNKLIAGITYDNLEHSVLELPSHEENGNEILGINDKAFENDSKIKTVIIPDNYTIIGASSFAGCDNLENVVLSQNSELEVIGTNAFGVSKVNSVEQSCAKLREINLPDGIKTIDAYAFYKCFALVLSDIPKGLSEVAQYSFSGTQIAKVDFINISYIFEGAFSGCAKLTTVENTQNIIFCDKYAFDNAGFYVTAINSYILGSNKKDTDALVYADTILVGCYAKFGKDKGSGKVQIADKTTLIANGAFLQNDLTELTINVDTEKASQIINSGSNSYDFLGRDIINDSVGVSIVVKTELYAQYIDRYPHYKDQICTQEIITVVGDNNIDQINWGKHIMLKFVKNGITKYRYDRFVPMEDGSPKTIDLFALFGTSYNLERINTNAFNNVINLSYLYLYNVEKIAYMAIRNCRQLIEIDLTQTVNVTILEHNNSLQFSTLNTNCKIYVDSSQTLTAYQSVWKDFATAKSKLEVR